MASQHGLREASARSNIDWSRSAQIAQSAVKQNEHGSRREIEDRWVFSVLKQEPYGKGNGLQYDKRTEMS